MGCPSPSLSVSLLPRFSSSYASSFQWRPAVRWRQSLGEERNRFSRRRGEGPLGWAVPGPILHNKVRRSAYPKCRPRGKLNGVNEWMATMNQKSDFRFCWKRTHNIPIRFRYLRNI